MNQLLSTSAVNGYPIKVHFLLPCFLVSTFGVKYFAEVDYLQLPRLALTNSSTFIWEQFIVDHLLGNVHLIIYFIFWLQYISYIVNSVHFFALKRFGTLHRESNNFFRIKKLKYFESEGYRFMKGLRISVFKTIKY